VFCLAPYTELDTAIKDSDLVWDTLKSGGKGGQHVNKTESAVRLTHLPSGIVIRAEEERSQHRNKSLALARLAHILKSQQASDLKNKQQDVWSTHNNVIRGNPVRTYVGPDFKLQT